MGEEAARAYLEQLGYTNIRSIQNASGHGIDLVGDLGAESHFFEVKASTTSRAPALSEAQRDINKFVPSRLQRAMEARGHWKRVSTAVKETAEALASRIAEGMPIQGRIIRVTHVGTPNQTIMSAMW
jgi:Holliday junction resolvase-like predicted endonuclease